MKKILLLASLMIPGLFIVAQSLVLSDDNGPLAPDAIVTFTEHVSVFEIIAPLIVTNTSNDTLMVLCKKTEISLVTGAVNMFCWTQCYGPGTYVSPEPLRMNPGFSDSLSFYGEYYANGNEGTSRIAYTFYDQNNLNDSVRVFIDYVTQSTGLSDLFAKGLYSISLPYPNPAINLSRIDYAMPPASLALVKVYNLLGAEVASYQLNEPSGQLILDVSSWKKGLYFYSLTVDGEWILTRRLIKD